MLRHCTKLLSSTMPKELACTVVPSGRLFSSDSSEKVLIATVEKGVRTIRYNRPTKLNAFNFEMYTGVQKELEAAANDNNTVVTVLTGTGNYYSSGNDLTMFSSIPRTPKGLQDFVEECGEVLYHFVESMIEFPKPLIAVANGPAVGIGATQFGLMDCVYASDRAFFSFPMVKLGQGPEGCSSYIFPRIMGPAKANEILYSGRKVSAEEAERIGFVTRVFPHEEPEKAWKEIGDMALLPPEALSGCKKLVRAHDKARLHQVNRMECDQLKIRWSSPECITAVNKQFGKSAK